MHRRLNQSRLLGALAAVTLVAACSTSAPATPAPATSAPATSAPATSAPATSAPTGDAGSKEFTVAFTSIGLSSVGMLAAIDALNEQGYTIDTPEVADNNLIVQGVSTGEFDFSSGTTLAVLIAATQDAPVKIIGDRVANEWTVTSKSEIADCAGLEGKRYAHHSEAAVSTAMGRNWIAEDCGATVQELIIAGSDNRSNALKADEIDATELELSDAISLLQSEGDAFHVLTSFSETLPDLKPSTIYGNADYMAANPDNAVALLTATLEQYERINNEPGYLRSLAEKYLENVNTDTIDEVAAQYVELGLFETDGGLTPENLEFTIQFFRDAGSLETDISVEEAADLSYLEQALGN